jgi:hypothetical protein
MQQQIHALVKELAEGGQGGFVDDRLVRHLDVRFREQFHLRGVINSLS